MPISLLDYEKYGGMVSEMGYQAEKKEKRSEFVFKSPFEKKINL